VRFPRLFAAHALTNTSGPFAFAWVRRAILAGWLAAMVVAVGVGVFGFRIDNSVGVWFAADDPALADYRRFLTDFGNREWILVALERHPANRHARVAGRDALVATLGQMDHVHRVLSSSDFPEESDLVRKFLKPNTESPYEALLLQVTNDIETQDGYREALVTEIRRVAQAFPTIDNVHVAGTAVINGELNRAARRDMFLFFPVVALFVALLGGVIFRNARDTAVLLSVSLGTVVGTESLLIGIGYPLNMITIMLPTVLIALSVADAVHLIHAFHTFRASVGDAASATTRAVKSIAWPCAGTSLTTIAGFLAFSGSDVLPVFQLAVFGAVGIAMAWVLTMTVAPVLLTVLWRETRRPELPAAALGERLLGQWWRFADRHPRWIVAAFSVAAVLLVGLVSLRADTDYVKFFRSGTRVPQDYQVLQREGFPQNPLNLVLRLPAGESPLSPEYLSPLRSFASSLETLPGVQSVLSPFVMANAPAAMGDQAASHGGMLSRQSDQLQFVVMMDHTSSQELFKLLPEIRALARRVLPSEMRLIPTGTSLLWARMDDGVIRTQRQSLLIVSVVCFGILAVLFRSLWLAALGLVFSLYPVAMVLGLMGLWRIPVNIATVLIAGIAVGLAVDDTIHVVHTFQELRRRGMDRSKACEETLVAVGLRMVMTSCILVGSFAIMGLSDFMPTSQFGLLSSLTIVLALAADATLLPVVLAWRRREPAGQRRTDRALAETVDADPGLSSPTAWGG
jgi:predicted RND superfamily exporter protein